MIEVVDVVKRFGRRSVLDGVSFTAAGGEITTLLGANGAGKTTILRAVTGILSPDSGTVRIDGADVRTAGRRARRQLGVVADHFGLYPYLTAREHLALAAALRGLDGDARHRAVHDAEDALGIAPFADTRGRHLSQGQAMRIAVARAIVANPDNVVMDEPTRGLDIFGVRLLRRLLFSLREQGKALLLTNHTLAEIEGVSDRLLVLARGRIVAEGSVAALVRDTGAGSLEESVVTLVRAEGDA